MSDWDAFVLSFSKLEIQDFSQFSNFFVDNFFHIPFSMGSLHHIKIFIKSKIFQILSIFNLVKVDFIYDQKCPITTHLYCGHLYYHFGMEEVFLIQPTTKHYERRNFA